MPRRTLTITIAALAATLTIAPGVANAAGSAHGSTTIGKVSAGGVVPVKPVPGAAAHFSSPAGKSFRAQAPALSTARSAAKQRTAAAGTADAGTVIYATTADYSCSPETGDGTEANPYCQVQDAVDAAVPGDTVDVIGSVGYSSPAPVTVTTSNISIVGIGTQAWLDTGLSVPALTLDHVTGVTVSNLMVTSNDATAVAVVGSSDITLDSDYLTQAYGSQRVMTTVTIDGASSGVTMSRTYLDSGDWMPGANAVAVGAGASDITFASNILADAGITATGVSGLNITGNTIQRGCSTGIDVEGASTAVSIENNLLEDANPNTDYAGMDGYQSYCVNNSYPWAPDVTVSADASTGTTADYNDFYVFGSDATAPYSWAGTAYPTLAAFRTGASQGAHDTDDSVAPTAIPFRPNEYSYADAILRNGSAAIGSANPAAPGALTTDFNGVGPYTSRGAVQYVSSNPDLSVGVDGEDTSAYGVTLSADVKSVYTALTLDVDWGDGTTDQSSFYGGQVVHFTHEYKKANTYSVTFTVSDGDGNTAANTVTVWTAGSDYTAYGPKRLLDTRNGTGAPKAKVKSHGTVHLKVAGTGTIPAAATVAVLNVTVTNPTAAGYITAYDDGDSRPTTSNVNFTPNQTVPNQVIVPIGDNGDVALYNGSGGTVNLIADIAGYFSASAASGYTALSPYRIVDTRNGTGAPKKQLAAHASFAAQIAGNDGKKLPASGITAVALNVTVTGPQTSGYLTAYPDGKSVPTASNLNFTKGQTIANSVIVPVGSDGKIRFYNGSTKATSVIADVVGYYSASGKSAYVWMTPTRYLDTRDKSNKNTYGAIPSGLYDWISVNGDKGYTAFVLNTTVTSTKGTGYLTVSPDPNTSTAYDDHYATFPKKPNVSTLNWTKGKTVPNLVQASTGSNAIFDFWNSGSGSTQLIVDAFGFYQNN